MEIIAVLSGAGSAGRCCIRPGRRAFWPTRGNVWLRPWWIGRSSTWPAGHLIELGDSASQAVAVGEPLTADAERLLGPDHSDTLLAWDRLAAAYRAVGRNAEAILLLELVLAGRERRLAAEHPQTLAARNNPAAADNAAGRAG